MTVTSPDISIFNFSILLDISTDVPSITLSNLSTLQNPTGLAWAFQVYSPSGTPIFAGDFTSGATGAWDTPFVINSGFPKPFGQIQWSGSDYQVKVTVRDTNGITFELTKGIRVCPPSGNTKQSKDTYGKASVSVITRCREAQLYCEDTTPYLYQGQTGSAVSKSFSLVVPGTNWGDAPISVVYEQFNTALIPIAQSGAGYQYFLSSVMDYAVGNDTVIRIKYQGTEPFTVYCNLDLTPIAYQIQKLLDAFEQGCADSEEKEKQLLRINTKLQLASMGILYPQSSIDPYQLIEDIKEIGGFDCDCNRGGLVPQASLGADGRAYSVIPDGGDISGYVELNGNDIRIHLSDYSYVFQLASTNTSSAFTIQNTTFGTAKVYSLLVDKDMLANEILTVYEGSAAYINRLKNLIGANLSSSKIAVNPRCLLPSLKTYNYTFTSSDLGDTDTYLVEQIVAGGAQKYINFFFDRTNASDLSIALNTLNIGTFNVTFVNNMLTIVSANNPSDITSFTGKASSADADEELTIQKSTTGTSSYSVGTIVQALIDFSCTMILSRIAAGEGYTIKDLQVFGQAAKTIAVLATDTANSLLQKFVGAFNHLVDVVAGLSGNDCASLQKLFTAQSGAVGDSSLLYGNLGNACIAYTPKQLALKMFSLGNTDPDVKAAMCGAVSACATTSSVCAAVTNATAAYDPATGNLSVTITNNGAAKYRVGYMAAGATTGLLGIATVFPSNGDTTSYLWPNVPAGTYTITIVAMCLVGESTPYSVNTVSCQPVTSLSVTSANGNFTASWSGVPSTAQRVRLQVVYPGGGGTTTNYPVTPGSITFPIPSALDGNYTFRLFAVCDEAQSWYSAPTADVIVYPVAISGCQPVSGVQIINITSTSMDVVATKPVGSTAVSFTARLAQQGGAAPIAITTNDVGATTTFHFTGLTAGKSYAVAVVTNCTTGTSLPYDGGLVATPPTGGGINSTVINNTAGVATYSTVLLDGLLIYSDTNVQPGQRDIFDSTPFEGYSGATVAVTLCNAGGSSASISSNGINYTQYTKVGDTFTFNNVSLLGGMAIQVS